MFCWKGKKSKIPPACETFLRVKMTVVGDSQCGKTSLIQRHCCGTVPHLYTPTVFDTSTLFTVLAGRKMQLVIQDITGQEDMDSLRPPFYFNTDVVVMCFSMDSPDSLHNVQRKWVPEVRRNCGQVPILLVANKADLPLKAAAGQDEGCVSLNLSSPQECSTINNCPGERPSNSKNLGQGESFIKFISGDNLWQCKKIETSSLTKAPLPLFKAGKDQHISARALNLCGKPDGNVCVLGQNVARIIGAVGYCETSALMNTGVNSVFETALSAAVTSKQWRKKYKL